MAMSLDDIERGAIVRLVEDEHGRPLMERPLGMIVDVKYRGANPDIWNAAGILRDEKTQKPHLFVEFGAPRGKMQIEARQLVLHQKADRAAQQSLKDRVNDEKAIKEHMKNPVLTDPLRLGDKAPVNSVTLEVKPKKSLV